MKGYQTLPEERCGNCKHYIKHYRRTEKGRYISLDIGHCVHPRIKNRRAEEHCAYWQAKENGGSDNQPPKGSRPQNFD